MKTGIRVYNNQKILEDTQTFDTEEDARETAANIGKVRGQTRWAVEVRQEGKAIAHYRGGKEFRPAGRRP